jgi:regulator of sirC expression with transglutaminase-like and TPR domain
VWSAEAPNIANVGKLLTAGDIEALIHLLGDDDPWVKDQARLTLRREGARAIPFLQISAKTSDEQAIRVESSLIMEDIHVDSIESDWVALQAADEGRAVEEGALLLERMIHPDRVPMFDDARRALDELADGARSMVPPKGPYARRVMALRRYLHQTRGFHGNVEDYYDPENSFLTRVLARRTGIPITLALVYLAVGHRLGVPLVGIGMPMHFLVGFPSGTQTRYLDPFYGGREVGREECLLLLERAGFEPAEVFLRPAPVVGILERMARNLIVIYQNGAREKELRLARRFVTVLTGEIV